MDRRQEYFDQLRKTSDVVKPFIYRQLYSYRYLPSDLRKEISVLGEKRLEPGTLLLKPFLVRLAYEAAGGKRWEDIASVCAAAEVLNISSYQSNLSFDGKFRKLRQIDRSNQFIASCLSRESLEFAFDKPLRRKFAAHTLEQVMRCLSVSNRRIYLGQFLDMNRLVGYNDFSNLQAYLRVYLRRCMFMSGVFSGECARIGAILAGAEGSVQECLEKVGRYFGIGLQIVNDAGDYLPPASVDCGTLKASCDQFSDFRLGKVTLPLFWLIWSCRDQSRRTEPALWNQDCFSETGMIDITRELCASGGITVARRIAKRMLKHSKRALKKLPKTHARDLLSTMLSQVRSNKFWHAFEMIDRRGSEQK